MKYPLGIQSFGDIRTDRYLYVDKTSYIYDIVSRGKYYFLSRPRRFGKSLLISTLEAYFKGKKELFKGLDIYQKEVVWKQFPVLRLDLNVDNYKSLDVLYEVLGNTLNQWERQYDVVPTTTSVSLRLRNLIIDIYEKTGKKVVMLVDEYDKPLLQTMDNEQLQTEMRDALKAFYGVLKPMDDYMQFGFFTGVTKFSKVSVFSDLNNLTDLSMDHRYVGLCGITEREIHEDLDEEVGKLAEAGKMSKEDCYRKLRDYYDGYHFCEDTEGIYNPYSLLNALSQQRFRDYWFETGTPSYLADTLRQTDYPLDRLTREEATSQLLASLDSLHQTPIPLIYQSGYLTIKDYDPDFRTYRLGFPNKEVEHGFVEFLAKYYIPQERGYNSAFIADFVRDVRKGEAEKFMQRLDALFASGDYQVAGDAELYFQNAVWVIFKMIGFYTEVERHTTDGRMDMLIQTQDFIYIIEFKLDKSANEALQQIKDKQYAKPFEHDTRALYEIGVNFSSRTRRIEGWKIQKLERLSV